MRILGIKKARAVIVAGNADLHPNSTVGLCPPVVQLERGEHRPHPVIKQYLWDNWENYWQHVKKLKKRHKAKVIAILNGDSGESNKYSSPQVITTSHAEMKIIAVDTLEPSFGIADEYFFTTGTQAHDGRGHWLAKWIAEDVEAVKDPVYDTWTWQHLSLDAAGVIFDIAHHPFTTSRRYHTRGADAGRDAAAGVYEVGEEFLRFGNAQHYDVRWRAHTHQFSDSGRNHPIRTVYSPPWKLTGNYGHRLGAGGRIEPVGGLIWICQDGQYMFKDRRYFYRRREPCRV